MVPRMFVDLGGACTLLRPLSRFGRESGGVGGKISSPSSEGARFSRRADSAPCERDRRTPSLLWCLECNSRRGQGWGVRWAGGLCAGLGGSVQRD